MNSFPGIRFSAVLAVLLSVISAGCNKTDTGVSKPFPDCNDNIQNQGELGIDCGGPCAPCLAQVTARIDGVPWSSQGQVTTIINNNSILFLSGNGTSSLSFIHSGPFENGTYALQSAIYTINTTQTNYISNQGIITFSDWNESIGQVFGTFSFTAFDATGSGDTIQVTQGQFKFVPYEP
jgi:hypothetical protein